MNMLGGVGAILSQILFGTSADYMKSLNYAGRAQWDPAWYAYVVVALIGMTLWSFVNPETTVERQGVETPCWDGA